MADTKNPNEYNCTRVTPSMVIVGGISSTDNLLVEGAVYGEVETSADITAKNIIVGNIKANNAAFDAAKIKGNVDVAGTMAVKDTALLVGDVKAKTIKLEGKVRGNVAIAESALLTETALLVGDISAQFVTTQSGARINGSITTTGVNKNQDFDAEFDLSDIENKGGAF